MGEFGLGEGGRGHTFGHRSLPATRPSQGQNAGSNPVGDTTKKRVSDRGYVLELGRNYTDGTGVDLLASTEIRRMFIGG